MNAVLYARYSSDNQREESITAQLRAEYEYCQRKEVKAEVSSLEEKLAELETRAIPYLTREQIIKVINHVQDAINKKSAENLRAIIQNFVNKIVVSKDEIVIEFKLKFEREWSGRRESNPRVLLGKQALCH